MEWQHPALQEMLQLGCSDRMKVMLAFQAYMKLCEVDKLRDVQYWYNEQLDLVYLSSADKKDLVLHVPVPGQTCLSPAWLHDTSTTLLTTHPQAIVNVLLKTPDTTFLTYRVTEGLTSPPTPEATKEKKALQEKLQYVHNELNKRKGELYEEAKRKRTEAKEATSSDKSDSEKLIEETVKEEMVSTSENAKNEEA